MAVLKYGIVIFVLVAAGCKAGEAPPQTLSAESLFAVPLRVVIRNRAYRLETYLWRNAMPRVGSAERPLTARVWVTAEDGRPMDPRIAVDTLWLVNGAQVWTGRFADERRPIEPGRRHQLDRIARDGPRWAPGVDVEVVVRLVDGQGGWRLLRAHRQPIRQVF